MRILFLSAGNSIHSKRWVSAMADRGHEVHLVFQADHPCPREDRHPKVEYHRLPIRTKVGYFANALFLRRLFLRIRPDVINAHYASGYGTMARLARVKPLLLSVWGSDIYDFPHKGAFFRSILRKNLSFADILASTSAVMGRETLKYVVPKVDLCITPFGVDTKVFSINEAVSKDVDEIVIGIVKTMSPKYGIDDLIRSVQILLGVLRNEGNQVVADRIRLHIYGGGPFLAEYLTLAQTLGVGDITTFFGQIKNSDVPAALNKIAIFALASVSESFGVAAVEAMACGLPIVATNVVGFCEVLGESGKCGLIVERHNPEQMACALKALVLDPTLRRRMGAAGRARVLQLYDWEHCVDIMEQAYIRLAEGNSESTIYHAR